MLGDRIDSSSSHELKLYAFQSRRNIFILLFPLFLLFGVIKSRIELASEFWRNSPSPATFQDVPGASLASSSLGQVTSGQGADGYSLKIISPEVGTVERYGLFELDLQTDIPVTNPYNPKEIDLKVIFTSPSGRRIAVGAFWYQNFDAQTRQPSGMPGWKARFTPDEAGQWTASAVVQPLSVQSEPIIFDVAPSLRAGFVRVNSSNPHYLATDDGNFFFPIGVNMAWWEEGKDPLGQYAHWLEQFTQNGGNTIRVWMASWSFAIEWKDSGLGNYSQRQYEAWLLDQLFRLADQYRVKIILVLVNHGTLSLTANSEWEDNPYNIALGGPLDSPQQFVSNPAATAYFEQRLSYIVNRWGYSTDLLAWEWFNEVDLTPITDKQLVPWLRGMTAFLRARDIYHHLTTNSFSIRNWSEAWHLAELDIVQLHAYSDQLHPDERDPAVMVGAQIQQLEQGHPQKPILMGEFGYSARGRGENKETTGIQLHNGIWATTFSGYAGSGMYWWWDTYIEPNDLWYHFKGLADFLRGEDLSQYHPGNKLEILDKQGGTAGATGMDMRGPVTLVWLRSDKYTVEASVEMRNENQSVSSYSPPMKESLILKLIGMTPGSYLAYWYDPQTADWISQIEVSSTGTTLAIPIPAFKDDLAAKIVKKP